MQQNPEDGTVRIWTDKGVLIYVLTGPKGEILSLAWSPDGTRLLSGDRASGVWLWDTTTGHSIRDIGGSARLNYALDWSPDGSRILMGGDSGHLTLWDAHADMPINTWNLADYSIYDVAYSPDGNHFVTTGNEGRVRIWAGDQEIATFQTTLATNGGDTMVDRAEWSSDGRYLLTGNSAYNVQLWRIVKDDGSIAPRVLYSLNYKEHAVQNLVVWSDDNTQFITGGGDGFIRVHSSLDGTLIREIAGHTSGIESLAWSPDSTMLAGTTSGGGLYVWNTLDESIPLNLVRNIGQDEPRTLDWSPSGNEVVIWSRNRSVQLWYPPTFDRLGYRSVAFAPVLGVGWLADGTRLALKQRSGYVEVMNSEFLQTITRLSCGANRVGRAAFSPTGTQVALTDVGGLSVLICDTFNGRLMQPLNGHSDWVLDMAWSPDGTLLATASINKEVIIWEVATGRQLQFWSGFNTPMEDMAWSPKGNLIALATTDQQPGRIEIRDIVGGQVIQTMEAHFSIVQSLAWSPDGRWLVSGSTDGIIILWAQTDN